MPEVDQSTTIKELEKHIDEIMGMLPEGQRNDMFRAVVLMGQMEFAKFIYHDLSNNPYTRYRKTKTKHGEIVAFGQALVQLLLLMKARKLDFPKVFDHAIEHMKDLDWMERKPKDPEVIQGIPVTGGKVTGKAYLVDDHNPIEKAPKGSIPVLEHAEPEATELMHSAPAVVTDQGGRVCHLAIVARERGIPAVVGTGNATSMIKTGNLILVDADEGRVTVSG